MAQEKELSKLKDSALDWFTRGAIGICTVLITYGVATIKEINSKIDTLEKSQIYLMTHLKVPIPDQLFRTASDYPSKNRSEERYPIFAILTPLIKVPVNKPPKR